MFAILRDVRSAGAPSSELLVYSFYIMDGLGYPNFGCYRGPDRTMSQVPAATAVYHALQCRISALDRTVGATGYEVARLRMVCRQTSVLCLLGEGVTCKGPTLDRGLEESQFSSKSRRDFGTDEQMARQDSRSRYARKGSLARSEVVMSLLSTKTPLTRVGSDCPFPFARPHCAPDLTSNLSR
jgi:hypothetical protein